MKLNVPSEKGRKIGLMLAESIACPTHEMCADCVFRHGTFPNGCEATLDDAMLCLIDPAEHGVFLCAHREDGATPICGGYRHARRKINYTGAILRSAAPFRETEGEG